MHWRSLVATSVALDNLRGVGKVAHQRRAHRHAVGSNCGAAATSRGVLFSEHSPSTPRKHTQRPLLACTPPSTPYFSHSLSLHCLPPQKQRPPPSLQTTPFQREDHPTHTHTLARAHRYRMFECLRSIRQEANALRAAQQRDDVQDKEEGKRATAPRSSTDCFRVLCSDTRLNTGSPPASTGRSMPQMAPPLLFEAAASDSLEKDRGGSVSASFNQALGRLVATLYAAQSVLDCQPLGRTDRPSSEVTDASDVHTDKQVDVSIEPTAEAALRGGFLGRLLRLPTDALRGNAPSPSPVAVKSETAPLLRKRSRDWGTTPEPPRRQPPTATPPPVIPETAEDGAHLGEATNPSPSSIRHSLNAFSFKVRRADGRTRSPLPPRVQTPPKPEQQQEQPPPTLGAATPMAGPQPLPWRQKTAPFSSTEESLNDGDRTVRTPPKSAGPEPPPSAAASGPAAPLIPQQQPWSGTSRFTHRAPLHGRGKYSAAGGEATLSSCNQQPPHLTPMSTHNGISSPPHTISDHSNSGAVGGFVTAGEQLQSDIKCGKTSALHSSYVSHRSPALGLRRSSFQSPYQQQQQLQTTPTPPPSTGHSLGGGTAVTPEEVLKSMTGTHGKSKAVGSRRGGERGEGDADDDASEYPTSLLLPDGSVPAILKPLDPKLVSQVTQEILDGAGARQVSWADIAGLAHAKSSVEEAIVWPLRRPDLFVGLRDPPRGLLLFGPPGTGKTMIARAIANRAQCTFLNISSSALMSKWLGDGEKMVRCLFAVATVKQPSVIFIDEIDSLLSARSEGEMDSVRRVKTEFLVQLDGVATDREDRVLLIGATNRPEELDEAARRRMEKRLYIPLPDDKARLELMGRLLSTLTHRSEAAATDSGESATAVGTKPAHSLSMEDLEAITRMTEGYSGADLRQLCREAAMGPLREISIKELSQVASDDLRPIDRRDFNCAVRRIKPSVGAAEVTRYEGWNHQFGSFADERLEE